MLFEIKVTPSPLIYMKKTIWWFIFHYFSLLRSAVSEQLYIAAIATELRVTKHRIVLSRTTPTYY